MRQFFLLFLFAGLWNVSQAQDLASPSGLYQIEIRMEEAKMSHWLRVPCLRRITDQKIIWQDQFPWSLKEHHWIAEEKLQLDLECYPDRFNDVTVILDLSSGKFRGGNGDGGPIEELNSYLKTFEAK